MQSLNLFLANWICLLDWIFQASSETITIGNNADVVKGGSIRIECKDFSLGVNINKLDSPEVSSIVPVLSTCDIALEMCLPRTNGQRYTFSVSNNIATIAISNLDRDQDQKYWICSNSKQKAFLFLAIYTPPSALGITEVSDSLDLALTSVILQCETDCAYPRPDITLFYTEDNQQYIHWTNASQYSTAQGTCRDSEQQYRSTFKFTRYTTWPSNVEKSVEFKCGINSFPGLSGNLFSTMSRTVVFAVKVTTVILSINSKTHSNSSIVEVTSGKTATVTCETGNSRPAATITWYIGNVKQTSTQSVFSFVPGNEEHGQAIYCKAFNFENENQAVTSGQPVLHVKVPVTFVKLKDGANTLSSVITTTVNQTKDLTCETGVTRPASTIIWFFGGAERFRSNTTLKFSFEPGKADHNMEIYCKAFNIQPESSAVASDKLKLYVRVPALQPQLSTSITGTFIFLLGDYVSVKCTSSATRPTVNVIWTLGGTQLNKVTSTKIQAGDDLDIVVSIVTFHAKMEYNLQKIKCETFIDEQSVHPFIQQNIQIFWPPSQPRIIPHDEFPWLEEQGNKSLECFSSDKGNPNSTTRWKTDFDQPAHGNPYLLLLPVLRSIHNDLTVTCTLANVYTEEKNEYVSTQIVLNVEYAPTIVVEVQQTLEEQKSLEVLCKAVGKPENYIFVNLTHTWLGIVIRAIPIPNSGEIILSNISVQDSGNYTCYGHNTIPNRSGELIQSSTALAVIEVKPTVFENELIFAGRKGGSVSVHVPFYCNPEVRSVQFFKPNDRLIFGTEKYSTSYTAGIVNAVFYEKQVSLNGYLATLMITNLTEEDFVNYTLMMQNKLGKTSVHLLVTAESTPIQPKHFYIEFKSGIPVLIWEKSFNGGFDQTFVIQTRCLDSGKWTNLSEVHESNGQYQLNYSFYSFNVTSLNPGIYTSRLIAYNIIGTAEPVFLSGPFTIALRSEDTVDEIQQLSASAIGGVVGGAVTLSIIAIVVVVVWKQGRDSVKSGCLKKQKYTRKTKEKEVFECYVNLQSSQYNSTRQGQSEVVTSTYESLQSEVKECCCPTYDKLHLGGGERPTTQQNTSEEQTSGAIYVNTKLRD